MTLHTEGHVSKAENVRDTFYKATKMKHKETFKALFGRD